jgi:lipopolysaccharide transport system permease protein
LILLFAVQLLLMLGLALLSSVFNTFFRDISHLLGVVFQFLFWSTPIVYSKANLHPTFQLILNLNPLTHMVEFYRYTLIGADAPEPIGLLYWGLAGFGLYAVGRAALERTRQDLVDLI